MPSDRDKIRVLDRERALFLKELSHEPNIHVDELAQKLGISVERAWTILRSFLAMLAEDRIEFTQVLQSVNKNLEPEFRLNGHDMENLVPLLDKYPDPNYKVQESDNSDSSFPMSQPEKKPNPITSDNNPDRIPITSDTGQGQGQAPYIPNLADELNRSAIPPQPQPSDSNVYDYGTFNVNSLNRSYDLSFIPGLTRIGLMRYVLQHLPNPPIPGKIESFIMNFELQQDEMMVNADTLRYKLREWFGERTGDQAIQSFCGFIRELKPKEQFGIRQLDPNAQFRQGGAHGQPGAYGSGGPANPFVAGAQFEDPFNTFYHSEGVLPFGMDIRSPSAKRHIYEYERQRREEKDEQKKRGAFLEDARMRMQMEMSQFMSGNSQNGGPLAKNTGNNWMDSPMMQMMMMSMMSGGRMQMLPYTDMEGKTQWRMEKADGNGHDPNALTARDMLEQMRLMYDMVDKKRDENTSLRDQITLDLVNRLDNRGNYAKDLLEFKKVFNELMPANQQPYGGIGGSPLEVARIMLESKKFDADITRADKVIDRQFDEKDKLRQADLDKEKESNKTRNTLIKSISSILATNIPVIFNLLMMLSGRYNQAGPGGGVAFPGQQQQQGGGLGGIMNLVGSLLGGGGGGGMASGGGGGGGMGGGLGNLIGNLFGGGGGKSMADDTEGEDQESDNNPFAKKQRQREQAAASSSGGGSESFDFNELMSSLGAMFGQNTSSQPVQQPGPRPVQPTGMPAAAPVGFPSAFAGMNFDVGAAKPRYTPHSVQVNPVVGANAFEQHEVEETGSAEFRVNTNLPPYQSEAMNQFDQFFSGSGGQTVNQTPQGTPQSQPQPVQEAVPNQAAVEDPYKIYTPTDFKNLPEGELQRAREEAKRSRESIESYLSSVNQILGHTTEEKKSDNPPI